MGKQPTSTMAKYRCLICGYVYDPKLGDPDGNIKPGTAFINLPDSWLCPICGATKSEFDKLD
jgi:rubredoxin